MARMDVPVTIQTHMWSSPARAPIYISNIEKPVAKSEARKGECRDETARKGKRMGQVSKTEYGCKNCDYRWEAPYSDNASTMQ